MSRDGICWFRDGIEARRGARLALATLAVGLVVAGCGGGEEAEQEPSPATDAGTPNIVVVMTDDQDVASMESMPIVQRELVRRGVELADSYVALSECCPSRATYLTGQHAHNHGVELSRPPRGGYPKLDGTNTLAVWLDEAGYRTGQIGRYLNYYGNSNVGTDPLEIPPGWDDWHVPVEHTEFQVYDYLLNENGRLREYGDEPSDYATDVFTRRAVEFIEADDDDAPFFLSVTPMAPHSEGPLDGLEVTRDPRPAPRDLGRLADLPLPQPASFAEPDDSDKPPLVREKARLPAASEPDAALLAVHLGRRESLLAVDRMVGEIVKALRRSGELDETYILFTSDNGYLLGQHRHQGKHLVYEESVRVPLVIRGPGLPAGETRSGLVQNIDLAPTIVDVAGAEANHEMDGVSMLPLARSGELDRDRHLLIVYPSSPIAFEAVRSPEGLIYVEYKKGPTELYDLREDPLQLQNVAGDPGYASEEERLAERLEALRACVGEACR